MIIYIGADHRGFKLKEILKNFLKNQGYEVSDFGNDHYDENDDDVDFAKLVATAVSKEPWVNKGILICGSGIEMDITANKFKGIRSALVTNPDQAYMSREHNNANILSLSVEFTDEEKAKQILKTWLNTDFSGEEKYKRRLDKISEIENL